MDKKRILQKKVDDAIFHFKMDLELLKGFGPDSPEVSDLKEKIKHQAPLIELLGAFSQYLSRDLKKNTPKEPKEEESDKWICCCVLLDKDESCPVCGDKYDD